MKMSAIKTTKKEVWSIAGKAFPDYTGRKFHIVETVNIGLHDLNWGGGTRVQYKAVKLDGSTVNEAEIPAPWAHQEEGRILSIPEGWAVVTHAIFCGTDMGLTVYVNPANMAKFLPQAVA